MTTTKIQAKGWFKQHKIALATATLLGTMGAYLLMSTPSVADTTQQQPAPSISALTPAGTLPDLRQMIKNNRDAVVNISVESGSSTGYSTRGDQGRGFNVPEDFNGLPKEFQELFKYFQQPRGNGGHGYRGAPRASSKGSGFIISKDGYVVTNAHVVDGGSDITVSLNDKRELKAKLVGTDKLSDIALLKVEANNLPIVDLGDSDKLEVGQWVVAIGAPFGLEHTATQGIVSALSRSLPSETYVPFIQTDAAVNPGNSGGPLFDLQGRVIGVNSQIYSRSGGYMGVSFAIPVNVVKNVTNQLKNGGQVSRGWLGVEIQGVDQDLADSFQLDRPHGALVASVQPSSPADNAGIQAGDVIVTFDDKAVNSVNDLPLLVGNTPINTQVPVKVIRAGKEKTLNATIVKLAGKGEQQPVVAQAEKGSLGVAVVALKDSERTSGKLKSKGVKINRVLADSPADEAGLEAGDIILAVNGQDVTTPNALKQAVQSANAQKPLAILLIRDERTRFVAVQLDS